VQVDALIELLFEVLAHNLAELHEHLNNTENKKTELRSTELYKGAKPSVK